MTNFEKYKDEILKIAEGNIVALVKGEIKACDDVLCENCDFDDCDGSCVAGLIKWLYEEYKELAPKLTAKERAFCEMFEGASLRYGHVARDECGILAFYMHEPFKDSEANTWEDCCDERCLVLKREMFSFVKWEDEKPWSIADLLKLEVE